MALPSTGVLALVGALLLVIRMPEAVFRAEFWAEDGLFYSEALANGASTLVEPYAGYFILSIRAVALVGSLLPPQLAPAFGNAFSIAFMASAAAFATSVRMPWPRSVGVLIAGGIILSPIGFELVGTLVHIVWPATVLLGFIAISREPESPFGRTVETIGLLIASATGIGSVLMLPLFAVGPRRRLLAVGGVAMVQIVTTALMLDERPGAIGAEWPLVPYVWILRSVVTPLVGSSLASTLPGGVVVGMGIIVVSFVTLLLLDRLPRVATTRATTLAMIVLLAVVIPIAGIAFGGEPTSDLTNPYWAPRYFWLAGVGLVLLIALHVLAPLRAAAIPLLILFVVGATLQFRIEAAPSMGWAQLSECIGGAVACEVPVAPGEKWNVHWQP